MIQVEKFERKHMTEIFEQKATAYLRPYITDEHIQALEKGPYNYTGIKEGRIVFCGGVVEYWPNRGEGWAMFDQSCKKEFISVHNAVKRFLDLCPLRRIEAAVDIGFVPGHRWVQALGFQLEAPLLKSYRPDGGDCSLYARVR